MFFGSVGNGAQDPVGALSLNYTLSPTRYYVCTSVKATAKSRSKASWAWATQAWSPSYLRDEGRTILNSKPAWIIE